MAARSYGLAAAPIAAPSARTSARAETTLSAVRWLCACNMALRAAGKRLAAPQTRFAPWPTPQGSARPTQQPATPAQCRALRLHCSSAAPCAPCALMRRKQNGAAKPTARATDSHVGGAGTAIAVSATACGGAPRRSARRFESRSRPARKPDNAPRHMVYFGRCAALRCILCCAALYTVATALRCAVYFAALRCILCG